VEVVTQEAREAGKIWGGIIIGRGAKSHATNGVRVETKVVHESNVGFGGDKADRSGGMWSVRV
jgi:hypothetical protein